MLFRSPSTSSKGKKRAKRAHSDDSVSPAPALPDEEIDDVVYVRRGKRATKRSAVFESDEDEDRPRKRKLIKGERPSTPDGDKADLLDEVDEGSTSSMPMSKCFP